MGTNTSGCLGVGDAISTLQPRLIETLNNKNIISMAAGSGPHVLVLTSGIIQYFDETRIVLLYLLVGQL